MSRIVVLQYQPDNTRGVVARFALDATSDGSDSNSPLLDVTYIEKKYVGYQHNPNGPRMRVRQVSLKGAIKAWCEDNADCVSVTTPRRRNGQQINVTIRYKPELAVDFRMRFT